MRILCCVVSLAVGCCSLAGCGARPDPDAVGSGARQDSNVTSRSGSHETIKLATTTSTDNSGLLDVLIPAFHGKTGIEVQVMPMGTGKALQVARDGNCDVVFVHAPDAERQFVDEGWGVDRRPVMYNDFVIIGPENDPADIRGAATAAEALRRIAQSESAFVSRGDNSGTHKKELALWRSGGIEPSGGWYRAVGKGMGETLTMADQMQAYTLTDRGTFIKFEEKIDPVILVEGDEALMNPYGVIAVNSATHPHVKYDAATAWIDFLTSAEGQRLIDDYRIRGKQLFHRWPDQPPTGDGD